MLFISTPSQEVTSLGKESSLCLHTSSDNQVKSRGQGRVCKTSQGKDDTVRGNLGNKNSGLACNKETSPLDLVSTKHQGLCLLPLSLLQKEGTPCPGRGTRAEVSSGSS